VETIQALHDQLETEDVHSQVLHTSHAFHSEMMEPILETFTDLVSKVKLSTPRIPFLSNVTGAWINDAQATDATYWARHLRQTVRFADGLGELLKESERILLEVGPGQTLGALSKQHPAQLGNQVVISSLPRPRERQSDDEFLLTSVGRFWLAGGQIDWQGFYAREQRQRVPLPTYPFERQRYYLEPDSNPQPNTRARNSLRKRSDLADWFYLPSWRQLDLPRLTKIGKQNQASNSWLVFSDERGVAEALVERLQQRGEEVVIVRAGEQLARTDDLAYTINPRQKTDYEALLKELVSRGKKFAQIIHLWSVTADDDSEGVESFERAQESGLYSLLFLTQALASQSLGSLQLVVVTDSVHEVSGSESLRPAPATVLGACKVIPQEYPEITCRSIDLVVPRTNDAAPTPLPTHVIEQLVAELTENVSDRVVAYRGRHRWVQNFEAVRLEKDSGAQSRLTDGGVYLITGGLGAVGLALAGHLARTHRAKLALLGRSGLPAREEWQQWLTAHGDDDEVSKKIDAVRGLEAAGAEVLLLSADVSDEQQMLDALALTTERFGRIDGVIHGAAAAANADKEISGTTPADCRRQFQSKVRGLLMLEKVFQGRELKFCLTLSSLSSVLGGMTFAAYAAANIFVDTFVRQHNQTHPQTWLSVNWDAWNFDGEERPVTRLKAVPDDPAVNPEDGGEALERILAMGPVSQVLVSTSDLYARLERWVMFESEPTAIVERIEASVLHPRPNLPDAYVAPANELEQELADTWQQLLGIDRVGIHDNFFELGGHSLLATMVMSRLRKEFGVELPLRSFFEAPTVSGLALVIAQRVIEDQDEQSIAQMLEGAQAARAGGD
jgi:acyl transferase domain-containing protein/acyl carrier protein